MTSAAQAVGRWGESAAAEYLRSKGYTIIDRNARTPYGELDLVALDPSTNGVVFVEVKARRSATLGPPEIAVTPKKKNHLRAAALAYRMDHVEIGGDWRIDVIAVTASSAAKAPEIVHFENAVGSE